MPGDPKECRLHAMHCAEIAAATSNQQLKSSLLEMSANWQKLACDLEATQAFMAAAAGEELSWWLAQTDEKHAKLH